MFEIKVECQSSFYYYIIIIENVYFQKNTHLEKPNSSAARAALVARPPPLQWKITLEPSSATFLPSFSERVAAPSPNRAATSFMGMFTVPGILFTTNKMKRSQESDTFSKIFYSRHDSYKYLLPGSIMQIRYNKMHAYKTDLELIHRP